MPEQRKQTPEQPKETSVLDEAAYALETHKRSRSLRDVLEKKITWHADEIKRLTTLRDRTQNSVLDMIVQDLTDILRM